MFVHTHLFALIIVSSVEEEEAATAQWSRSLMNVVIGVCHTASTLTGKGTPTPESVVEIIRNGSGIWSWATPASVECYVGLGCLPLGWDARTALTVLAGLLLRLICSFCLLVFLMHQGLGIDWVLLLYVSVVIFILYTFFVCLSDPACLAHSQCSILLLFLMLLPFLPLLFRWVTGKSNSTEE